MFLIVSSCFFLSLRYWFHKLEIAWACLCSNAQTMSFQNQYPQVKSLHNHHPLLAKARLKSGLSKPSLILQNQLPHLPLQTQINSLQNCILGLHTLNKSDVSCTKLRHLTHPDPHDFAEEIPRRITKECVLNTQERAPTGSDQVLSWVSATW